MADLEALLQRAVSAAVLGPTDALVVVLSEGATRADAQAVSSMLNERLAGRVCVIAGALQLLVVAGAAREVADA